MKRWQLLGALLTLPLLLVGAVWQAGNYAVLAEEARSLESDQREWLDANRKLAGGIAVLQSRERAADLAVRLGLLRAGPTKRIFIVPDEPQPASRASDGRAEPSPVGRNDG